MSRGEPSSSTDSLASAGFEPGRAKERVAWVELSEANTVARKPARIAAHCVEALVDSSEMKGRIATDNSAKAVRNPVSQDELLSLASATLVATSAGEQPESWAEKRSQRLR